MMFGQSDSGLNYGKLVITVTVTVSLGYNSESPERVMESLRPKKTRQDHRHCLLLIFETISDGARVAAPRYDEGLESEADNLH